MADITTNELQVYSDTSSNLPNSPTNYNELQAYSSSDSSDTTTIADIYPYNSNQSLSSPYKNYLFPNMFNQQTSKLSNRLLRFSLVCNGFKFQAHLDPSHISDDKSKRVIQKDTLTGIVLQDYGYTAQHIELRGTTGAAYYEEIRAMNNVFNNQSTSGKPTPATLVIESRTYTGVWLTFTFERMAQENTYKYSIGFVVLKTGNDYSSSTPMNFSSAQTQAGTLANSMTSTNGNDVTEAIEWAGNSPTDYVNAVTDGSIPIPKRQQALDYIAAHWSDAPENTRSYPGDRANLNQGEILTIAQNWANVLK